MNDHFPIGFSIRVPDPQPTVTVLRGSGAGRGMRSGPHRAALLRHRVICVPIRPENAKGRCGFTENPGFPQLIVM